MPTFLLPQPLPIDGLSCLTDTAVWLGKTAQSQMRDQIQRAGLSIGDSEDVITLTPGCVATADAIRLFVSASEGVEGDVVENALEIINNPSSVKLLQYGITNDTAWEVGLACGGDIKIRIDTMKSNG